MRATSFGGHLYFATFIDDFTRFCWVFGLKEKSDVFLAFRKFVLMAENACERKLVTLRTDRGGEYMSHEFSAFMHSHGIVHQCTTPYTPQQNGVAERRNRTLMEMARCMLKSKDLSSRFWLEAAMCANYVRNRCPIKALKSMIAYEAWNGRVPVVTHMRIFGSLAYVHVPAHQRHKLEAKALKCIFVGYSSESKGYQLYVPSTQKIIESQDVIFDEYASQPLLTCKQQPTIGLTDVFVAFVWFK
ncbi:hypothetical protein L7F22_037015 [Adiantum nelumboides]|nr:hypothetical protein [Adiantum nelumboides]